MCTYGLFFFFFAPRHNGVRSSPIAAAAAADRVRRGRGAKGCSDDDRHNRRRRATKDEWAQREIGSTPGLGKAVRRHAERRKRVCPCRRAYVVGINGIFLHAIIVCPSFDTGDVYDV